MNALSMMLVSGLVLGGSAAGAGQDEDTYGTATLTSYMIPATSFTPRDSATTYSSGTGIDRFITSAGSMAAGPMLPNGAQIERIELRACDSNPAAEVVLFVGSCPVIGMGCGPAGSIATGATPGCATFVATLAAPLVVDNTAAPILVTVGTGTTSTTTFQAVKLYYRLRVSPAPATATFPNDVPMTHPFFRFVEALAAAGITGGCGTGAYCPDAPVTRGQMAVFLATALGLHFPN
jgi:hypothetical protein